MDIILANFGDFLKLKSPNLSSFYVNFVDKHVGFGFHTFLKSVSMIKRDNC